MGWSGDPTWTGQEGGWKAANCANLVRHADGDMNMWITDRDPVLKGSLGSLIILPAYYNNSVDRVGNGVEDGVGEEMFLGGTGESDGVQEGDNEGDADI